MSEHIDTVVVGGGQAALAMSYYLSRQRREHVLLERARVAERWRSERWDSLNFQFPNWSLHLPGFGYNGPEPDRFAGHDEVADFVEDYGAFIRAPLRCGVAVTRLDSDGAGLRLSTSDGTISTDRVVIATGPFQKPMVPFESATVPGHVTQLHASQYLNEAQLPPGAVLVVGTGSSGCQIAEELYQRGRTVYLSVSSHRRAPRRYLGKDLLWWMTAVGRFDMCIDRMPGRKIPPPLLMTGADGGHDVDLRDFARDGVILLGHCKGAQDGTMWFEDDVERKLADADDSFQEFLQACREHQQTVGLEGGDDLHPPVRTIEAARPIPSVPCLDLEAANVNAILWCTGYRFDFDWVRVPVLDARGVPLQRRGVTEWPNVYFLGLHWMHTMKSGVLFGVGEDAAYLADQIAHKT